MSNPIDILTRRRLASELMEKVISPNPNGWSEKRCALVSNATGDVVAILPTNFNMAGANEIASMLPVTVEVIDVTVTISPVAGD